jgi:DNA invertase Pin-like site-specific DNA recombinase
VSAGWSSPVSTAEAYARAAGRRHYNAKRRDQALARQAEIVRRWDRAALLGAPNPLAYGGKTRLAREFGVSAATVTRDLRRIRERLERLPCPVCSSPVDRQRWEELERQGRVKIR